MPAVKAEEVNHRLPNQPPSSGNDSRNGSVSSSGAPLPQQNDHRPRQYAIDRSVRNRINASPYRAQGREESSHQHAHGANREAQGRDPMYTPDGYASLLNQAIGNASHELLLNAGNMAYGQALHSYSQIRREVEEYRRQNAELATVLEAARNSYGQLAEKYRAALCHVSLRIQGPNQPQQGTAMQASTSVEPCAGVGDASTRLVQVPNGNGPIAQIGGFKLQTWTGPWKTTTESRPSDLPLEVFWQKSDWSGKGYSNWTFVRDRSGNHLQHLMRGIRDTARKIWNELDKDGCQIEKSFNKNGYTFRTTYVGTIEEIYPCLKLCSGHWKALQIGVRTYPHWYASRSKKRAEASKANGVTGGES